MGGGCGGIGGGGALAALMGKKKKTTAPTVRRTIIDVEVTDGDGSGSPEEPVVHTPIRVRACQVLAVAPIERTNHFFLHFACWMPCSGGLKPKPSPMWIDMFFAHSC